MKKYFITIVTVLLATSSLVASTEPSLKGEQAGRGTGSKTNAREAYIAIDPSLKGEHAGRGTGSKISTR
jgi:hypothetical protein